jgi:hypothetical protein
MECTQNLYPKCIQYHPTPIGATCAFRLMWSDGVYPKSVPKMYLVSSNADRSNSRFSFYVECMECPQNLYPKCIKYHPTLIGATRAFRLMWSAWSVTKICTQNVLSIIQRQSEQLVCNQNVLSIIERQSERLALFV